MEYLLQVHLADPGLTMQCCQSQLNNIVCLSLCLSVRLHSSDQTIGPMDLKFGTHI